MRQFCIGLIVGLICGALGYSSFHTCMECELPHVPEDTAIVLEQPEFFLSDTITIEGLYKACDYYEIQQPDIVVAQAILETGLFKSDLCIEHHNLFGLYNSRIKEYYHFNHWTESVKAYRNKVQYRYQDGDYYDWLERISYAEDSLYVSKLKNIRINYNLGVE